LRFGLAFTPVYILIFNNPKARRKHEKE